MVQDDRIVYGVRCFWWEGIENVSSRGGLPCCPHCKGMLFEMASPKEWWDGVEKFETSGHPGYRAFVEWSKGKHFANIAAAVAAYNAKPGRNVTL